MLKAWPCVSFQRSGSRSAFEWFISGILSSSGKLFHWVGCLAYFEKVNRAAAYFKNKKWQRPWFKCWTKTSRSSGNQQLGNLQAFLLEGGRRKWEDGSLSPKSSRRVLEKGKSSYYVGSRKFPWRLKWRIASFLALGIGGHASFRILSNGEKYDEWRRVESCGEAQVS